MEYLHFLKRVLPDFLTDDFGTLVQVIPGEHCLMRNTEAEQRIVNGDSWAFLIDFALEGRSE